jgi:integration host factor subunit alpha
MLYNKEQEIYTMKKLNRKDLVDLVAEEGHLSKKEARQAVDVIFDHIAEALVNGQEVNITNFGVFEPKMRKQRDGTDPKSHKRIVIKEKRSVSFRLSKQLKGNINQ